MIKYERIVGFFVILLIVFFIIIGLKWGCELNNGVEEDQTTLNINKEIIKLKREIKNIKARVANVEHSLGAGVSAEVSVPSVNIDSIAKQYTTVYISRENVNNRVIWKTTNKDNVFIVSINLEQEPYPDTILAWTGNGMLPTAAYNVSGNIMSVIMQQPKKAFIATNNFIVVRYLAKPYPEK